MEKKSYEADQEIVNMMLETIKGYALSESNCNTNRHLQGLYARVYSFYQSGRLEEAEAYFRCLYLYDFHNPDYALSLAAVYQLGKHYKKAITLYTIAFALAQDDYRPVLYTGLCYLALKKKRKAQECFRLVSEHCMQNGLREKALSYLVNDKENYA